MSSLTRLCIKFVADHADLFSFQNLPDELIEIVVENLIEHRAHALGTIIDRTHQWKPLSQEEAHLLNGCHLNALFLEFSLPQKVESLLPLQQLSSLTRLELCPHYDLSQSRLPLFTQITSLQILSIRPPLLTTCKVQKELSDFILGNRQLQVLDLNIRMSSIDLTALLSQLSLISLSIGLEDSLPSVISTQTNLINLEFYHNPFQLNSGHLESLKDCTKLQSLRLPTWLGELNQLLHFSKLTRLSLNAFNPAKICTLIPDTEISQLELRDVSHPIDFAALRQIRDLKISIQDQTTHPILSNLSELQELRSLTLLDWILNMDKQNFFKSNPPPNLETLQLNFLSLPTEGWLDAITFISTCSQLKKIYLIYSDNFKQDPNYIEFTVECKRKSIELI